MSHVREGARLDWVKTMPKYWLSPHPSEPAPPAVRVSATIELHANTIQATYELEGELGALRIPPQRPSTRGHELWKATCFELFFGLHDAPEYYELNVSPSSEWDGFCFSDYRRQSDKPFDPERPTIDIEQDNDRLRCGVKLSLPTEFSDRGPRLAIGLSAVLQDERDQCSYWALSHGSANPDFHNRQSFSATIAP
ncbi:MAG: DOMON-like domain-containing protein [Pseudomonadota bacterium]